MYEVMTGTKAATGLTNASSFTQFASELLNALPMAIAAPFLSYQKTKAQKDLIMVAVEAKRLERKEILYTMWVLAEYGALTPEIVTQLMVAYNATQLPY